MGGMYAKTKIPGFDKLFRLKCSLPKEKVIEEKKKDGENETFEMLFVRQGSQCR